MKTTSLLITTLAFGALSATSASAATWEQVQTVVHETTTPVEIDLDESTVLCSAADYGALFLKILIPELASITLLDHQNVGAGAPCVAAGMCFEGNMPADLLSDEATELVDINVKAIRLEAIDHDAETCNVTLEETVHVWIRGKEFTHQRFAQLGERPYADCLLSSGTPTDDPEQPGGGSPIDFPFDDAGSSQPEASVGGCATGGGSGRGIGLFLALALVGLRRRQRQR